MTEPLSPGFHALIVDLQNRLAKGESFDNPRLNEIAENAFGGTRAQGVYTCRDAYDAQETAVNKHLLEAHAAKLLAAPGEAFGVLSSLTDRLATQADRTVEQTEYQQFS